MRRRDILDIGIVALMIVIAAVVVLWVTGAFNGGTLHPAKPQLVGTQTAKSGQRVYKVRLPNGHIVTQLHDPKLAEPAPSKLKLLPPPVKLTTVKTDEQYDSVTIGNIPRGAQFAAGYADGLYRNLASLRAWVPHATIVGISVSSHDGSDCLDMEPGNPPASAAGPWAKWQLTQGNSRPCEYSMLSWMGAIKQSLASSGVPVCYSATQDHCVRLWDANWTYRLHLDSGYACTQWTDHAGGINLDESTCADWFYHRSAPAPVLPICVHHRMSKSACNDLKSRVASDGRARASSQRAWYARGCRDLRLRRNWFWQHINKPPRSKHDYRLGAYRATRGAFVKQACPVFGGWQGSGGRIGYFNSRIKALQAQE